MGNPLVFTHIEQLENFTIFDTKWIPKTAKFIVIGGRSNNTGVIKVHELNSGNIDLVRELNKKSTLKCGAPLYRTQFAIGDFDGTLQILNVERLDGFVYTVNAAHQGIINSIDASGNSENNYGPPEIVTGGQDGIVKVWDPRQKDEPVACMAPLSYAEGGNGVRDCWSVAFGNLYKSSERVVCAGYDNGDIKLFDLRTMKLQWETNIKHGICSIAFNETTNSKLNQMAASTLEGGLNVYNLNDQSNNLDSPCISKNDADAMLSTNGLNNFKKTTVWCVRYLPQNKNIIGTCGGSGKLKLWLSDTSQKCSEELTNIETPADPLKLLNEVSVSSKPVNCFDWNVDRTGLAVCGSFDQKVSIILSANLPLVQR